MTKLPEPTYIWHDNPRIEHDNEMFEFKVVGAVDESHIYPNGKCEHCTRLYTADQLRQYARDVLEEAIGKCKNVDCRGYGHDCAAAIQTMKDAI